MLFSGPFLVESVDILLQDFLKVGVNPVIANLYTKAASLLDDVLLS